MQVYKIIPSNPNMVMVRNTLAVYGGLNVETRSVGDLVALAKVGGTTVPGRTPAVKSAFAISEVGGTTGKLIVGAEPFWNLFSTNQPGFWFLNLNIVDFTISKVIHKIPMSDDPVGPMQADLLKFAAHDMGALAPTMQNTTVEINEGNTEVNVQFPVNFNFGNYDWRNVSESHQHYKIFGIKKDYPSVILGESTINTIPNPDGVGRQKILTLLLSNNPDTYGNVNPTIGYSKAFISKSDGSEICELPVMVGELKLNIKLLSRYIAQVYIDGDISITNKRTGGFLDQVTYPHDVISFSAKKFVDLDASTRYDLQNIVIKVREISTGNIVFTYSRNTSAAYYDAPKMFTTNIGGQTAIEYELIMDLFNSGFSMTSHGFECVSEFYYISV